MRKSHGVRVDHEKKSGRVRVDNDKKSDGGQLTIRKRGMG